MGAETALFQPFLYLVPQRPAMPDRAFLLIMDRAPTDGEFSLDSLSNHGRLDVGCRFLNAALFNSYSLRRDVDVHLLLRGEPDPPIHMRFSGEDIKGLHPDVRSIAGYIRTNLRRFVNTGEEANEGVSIDRKELEEILDASDCTSVVLHEDGDEIDDGLPDSPLFVVGDDKGLQEDDRELLKEKARTVAIGPEAYQAHQVASFVNIWCDRL